MLDTASIPNTSVSGKQNERKVVTIKQFCYDYGICEATFHNLQKRGEGPKILKIGARRFVTVEAIAEWRREMEGAAA